MQLKEWLDKNKIQISTFAKTIGVTYHQVYWVIRGCRPTLKTAQLIHNGTYGQVTYEEMANLKDEPEIKERDKSEV